MKNSVKYLFITLLLFSICHLVRDLFQNYNIQNFTTNIFQMNKNWCGNYCNWITFPFEFFIMISSLIIIKRNKVGILGYLEFLIFLIWIVMFLYDYFIFN